MSTGVTYFWGCVGGFFAAGFVYVLPWLSRFALTGKKPVTSNGRFAAVTAVMAFLTGAAGVVAIIPDQVTRGRAITIGFMSQTIIKGLISGVRDALPPNPPSM